MTITTNNMNMITTAALFYFRSLKAAIISIAFLKDSVIFIRRSSLTAGTHCGVIMIIYAAILFKHICEGQKLSPISGKLQSTCGKFESFYGSIVEYEHVVHPIWISQ